MDHAAFERQVNRLAVYFRKAQLSNDQKQEWWDALGHHDLADFTRATSAMITEGRVGQLPTIAQAAAATAQQKAWRQGRSLPAVPTPANFPTNDAFQADAKVNMMRLFGPAKNARGKTLGMFHGDKAAGLTPTQQAQINLVMLAERHKVDISKWPFLPDGDPAKLKAYQAAFDHMNHPTRLQAPTASDLDLLNAWWVDCVYRPTLQENLDRIRGVA